MKTVRRILAAGLVVSALVTTASAVPIFGDPTTIALLAAMEQLLRTITAVELATQALIQGKIDGVLSGYAFPLSAFRTVEQTIDEVKGIRAEAEALACNWRFSSRTALLRDLYKRPVKLCRPSFQLLWGSNNGHWDADLQEAHDYVGTLTTNMISERVQAEETWRQAFPSVEGATATLGKSPGEANRDEAVALAGSGVAANSNSAFLTQDLLLRQMEREAERFEERKRLDMAQFLLLSASGVDPLTDPPPQE